MTTTLDLSFDAPDLLASLEAADAAALDDVAFGIIGLAEDTRVVVYNAAEARKAGLSAERVLGRPFFTEVAPCMNNYMVAQRYADEPHLDATIDYVLTLRMRPTPVKLRMLKGPSARRAYLLVRR